MPTIRNPHVVQAIAQEYIANGRNKEAALLSVEYSKSYARSKGMKLYEHPLIKAAIDKLEAGITRKTGITIRLQQTKHARLARLAEEKGDLATATRNEELIGKTIGAYQDNVHTTTDQQRELDESEAIEACRIANIRIREA